MSGHGVGQAERRSWERSLPILAQGVVDAGLASSSDQGCRPLLSSLAAPPAYEGIDAVGSPGFCPTATQAAGESDQLTAAEGLCFRSGSPRVSVVSRRLAA
ncbi:hypothetical protein GCM10009835_41720 [Planosporangium flavigriseum]|uniref:Uncharacterized protein n=1 Tax=Planosporangium flavigriseum TaxID=373681 RepID=A0A8J3PLL3_9ACTN|nr:hypothetical protein Pfl04_23410 [Planosporangium flavigriseum]